MEVLRRKLETIQENWPITGGFRIARGAKTQAQTLMVCLQEESAIGVATGRGECVPYGRYGESLQSVTAQIEAIATDVRNGLSRDDLQDAMPAGAARNALDCALWDLEAKQAGKRVWQLAELPQPKPVHTAFTISIGNPDEMAQKAKNARQFSLLKLKLAGDGQDRARLSAISTARPDAALILDANEGLNMAQLQALLPELEAFNIALIEQPLPANADAALCDFASPIPLCADESLHTAADLPLLAQRYGAVNIKLDKTGGLTEAIKLTQAAKARGLMVMLGCMVGTSLGMAPSLMLGSMADYVDLDGPLLLGCDREPGLNYEGSRLMPPIPALWG